MWAVTRRVRAHASLGLLAAVLLPLVALLIRLAVGEFLSGFGFLLFVPAVVAATFLGGWVKTLRGHQVLPGQSFNLDFHSIPFFGADEFIEKHYVSRRSRRQKSVLAFLAQDGDTRVLCYCNADLRKGDEADEVLAFVRFLDAANRAAAVGIPPARGAGELSACS